MSVGTGPNGGTFAKASPKGQVTVDADQWEKNKAIADGMRAAARYQKAGRIVDFQTAMMEVMNAIEREGQF